MGVYNLTDLGKREVAKYQYQLPIRVRTLLVILSTNRVPHVSIEVLERIASPENFQILEDLGFIDDKFTKEQREHG